MRPEPRISSASPVNAIVESPVTNVEAPVGVPGRLPHRELADGAEPEAVAILHQQVGVTHPGPLAEDHLAPEPVGERAARGHMVGVHVGVEHVEQMEPQLFEELGVTLELLQQRDR